MSESRPDIIWDTSTFSEDSSEEFEWEFLCEELTTFIKKVNPLGEWGVIIENFGWQNSNGYGQVDASDGLKLLQAVLPNTECTFKIWLSEEEKKITINNAHHDKPTGGEMYYITAIEGD